MADAKTVVGIFDSLLNSDHDGIVIALVVLVAVVYLTEKIVKLIVVAKDKIANSSQDTKVERPGTGVLCALHDNKLKSLEKDIAKILKTGETAERKISEILKLVSKENEHMVKAIYTPSDLMDEIRSILKGIDKIPLDKIPPDFASGILRRMDMIEALLKKSNLTGP